MYFVWVNQRGSYNCGLYSVNLKCQDGGCRTACGYRTVVSSYSAWQVDIFYQETILLYNCHSVPSNKCTLVAT